MTKGKDIVDFGAVKVSKLNASSKNPDPIAGFGVQRYKPVISGAVGDQFPVDYSSYKIPVIANSLTGEFQFSKPLTKYNRIEVDVVNSSLNNVGMPHWVIEDTLEWVNSGTPSHLSQVRDSNVILSGIANSKIFPGTQEHTSPSYQAKYIVPTDTEWYDKLNSTIDYSLVLDNGNKGLSLPYPNAVLYFPERNEVWVGGLGGVLAIDVVTKVVTKVVINSDRTLLIKDIKQYQNQILILDQSKLHFYDTNTSIVVADTALGLPSKLHRVISVFGSNLVIAAEDGIYARKVASGTWEKVVSTKKPVNVVTSPDAILAVADTGESFYSTDGFTWTRVGVITSSIVNKLEKHRSQIFFATNKGLYQDNGSFYTKNVSTQLLDVLGDPQESSNIIVNDIVSNFNQAVIGLSDGRYIIYSSDFVLQPESNLSTIHKTLLVGGDIWLFGYNQFRIVTESFVRKLATGISLR